MHYIFFSVLQTTGQRIQGSTVSPSFVTAATSATTTTQSGAAAMGTPIQQPGNVFSLLIHFSYLVFFTLYPLLLMFKKYGLTYKNHWPLTKNYIPFRYVFSEPATLLFAHELSSQWADSAVSTDALPSGWNGRYAATHAHATVGHDPNTLHTASTAWSTVEKLEKLRWYLEWNQERREQCLSCKVTSTLSVW